MAIKEVHYKPDGIYLDHHPDPRVSGWVDEAYTRMDAHLQHFLTTLESTPNLNEKYAAEIAAVHSLYASKGLEISPITVLDPGHFATINALLGNSTESGGFNAMGQIVLREYDEPDSPLAATYILGNALHESAHSTAAQRRSLVATEYDPALGKTDIYPMRNDYTNNLHKFYFTSGEGYNYLGIFPEEAFADLSRVRGLQQLGRNICANNSWIALHDFGIRYINEDVAHIVGPAEDGTLDIPVRFTYFFAVNEDGTYEFDSNDPGVAAYGLELLDQHLPGLFEQMEQARKDPTLQRIIIRRIESIRPGLYPDLRSLRYNIDDFKQGVRWIQDAIQAQETTGDLEQPS